MDVARYAQLFLADTREQLRAAGALLADWEREPDAVDAIPDLFRAFHSVKGAAAAMGYDAVAQLAHASETLLDSIRTERLTASPAAVGLLAQSVDVLERAAESSVKGEEVEDASALTEALKRMATSAPEAAPRQSGAFRAPRPSGAVPTPPGAQTRLVRVEPARLDELLLQAGELVVAWNRIDAIARGLNRPELESAVAGLGTLVRANHASVLKARLAPVGELFDRVPRIVRDVAGILGRSVRVAREEREDIRLDRGMLDALVDPLVHLVRNAVDHGIESPEERAAAGKATEGVISLWATRERDWVTIHVTDDGRGIDQGRVVERAVALGLRDSNEPEPTADELLSLVARPGLTVKRDVSAISGRGVGMDVVVTAVRALGGRVELETEPGRGSRFRLIVPMTTAIQRVLLVEAGRGRFALPFRLVLEASLPEAAPSTTTSAAGFTFRARQLPVVDLARAVGASPSGQRRRPVLVLEWGAQQGALVVDALLGQIDVRIERVEAPVGLPGWVSGATILADGAPAFVLDPTALFSG